MTEITLNAEQKAAVETESNMALLLAGAGSGKTRTLTERIAYLIEKKKVSPYEVCAFTFTRKAAQEMKDRLEKRIGPQAHKVTMGTMHSLALRQLRRFGEIIGLRPSSITVYSPWEEAFLLREIGKDLRIYNGKKWKVKKKDIDAAFSAYYQTGKEPEAPDPCRPIFKTFMARCRENNALTYGGLLIGMEMLIPTLAKHLHWKHILVDEVQDIDPLQWRIINRLNTALDTDLFIVGDIDQSIYEFRGAVPRYLIDHAYLFDTYRLEINYRSDENIVAAANRLIRHNSDRLDKTMRAFEDAQTPIRIERGLDSGGIVGLLQKLNETGPDAQRAILCRNHAPLKKLSMLLEDAGIDHTYIGRKTELTNTEEFRRFHAFLKLIVNPYDNFSFLLVKDLIGVFDEQYRAIRHTAVTEGKSHFQAWAARPVGPGADVCLSQASWASWFEESPAHDLSEISGTLASRLQMFGDWAEAVLEFILLEWIRNNPTGTLEEYLSWLATYDLQDEMDDASDGLILSTIHAAKGLEWNTVIIAGMNEGLLPSKQAAKNGEIEPERRLAYVAATRAKDTLILTVRPEITETEHRTYQNPESRFVKEMMG